MTPLETLARLLPLLPGTDRVKAALLGVQPANLSTWLAEAEGRARPPAEGRAGRRRWRAVNGGDVARVVDLLREHGADVDAALSEFGIEPRQCGKESAMNNMIDTFAAHGAAKAEARRLHILALATPGDGPEVTAAYEAWREALKGADVTRSAGHAANWATVPKPIS